MVVKYSCPTGTFRWSVLQVVGISRLNLASATMTCENLFLVGIHPLQKPCLMKREILVVVSHLRNGHTCLGATSPLSSMEVQYQSHIHYLLT